MKTRTILHAAALGLGLWATTARAATITVNSTADTTGGAPCTLRDAITAANGDSATAGCAAGSGADVIAFAIPAAADPGCVAATGVCTIQPSTALPAITSIVDVNGFTQAGAAPNTLAAMSWPGSLGLDTQIRIEIDGTLLPGSTGLALNAGSTGSRLRGLSIRGFHTQIILNTGSNLITGNYVGTRADGVTPGTSSFGISSGGSGNTIGGTLAADRNLITSAGGAAVFFNGGNSNTISGNLIGTDRTGTVALSSGTGIQIRGTTGPATNDAIQTNVIAGNSGVGLELLGTASTGVVGNAIGIAVGGGALGNGWGIVVQDNSAGPSTLTVISGNGIANSTFANGISLIDASGSAGFPTSVNIDGANALWNNAQLGIDLRPASEGSGAVTPNDALDADDGPNGLQNYPVITSATRNGTGPVVISFTLDSSPNETFGITAWANPDCSAASAREARYPTGQVSPNVTTDAAGHYAGTLTVGTPLPAGWGVGSGISMAARNTSTSSTSELSACVLVTAAVPVELQAFDAE